MLRALIIDDDITAADTLQQMLLQKGVQVQGKARDGIEGIRLLSEQKPDVLFLDVEIPGRNGFDLLKAFREIDFHIIFVTADEQYALQAIQFSALDYLLKPVNGLLLDKALQKVRDRIHSALREKLYTAFTGKIKTEEPHVKTIALPTLEGFEFVEAHCIVRCDAEGNYTKVTLLDKSTMLVCRCLKEFEHILTGQNFLRVHNSHIINLDHIKKYQRGEGGLAVMSDGSTAEISRSHKEEFLSTFIKP